MYKPIRDYAIIGNRRSAVLVAKNGSIDWAPAPYLDSASVFAAVLDDAKGGFWGIRPEGEFTSTQQYIRETNVLVTTFETKEGTVDLVDCMPIRLSGDSMTMAQLLPESEEIFEIYRKISCAKGSCRMKVIFYPKFDYARGETKLRIAEHSIVAQKEQMEGILISKATYEIDSADRAIAFLDLKEGETHYFAFRFNTLEIPSKEDGYYENAIEQTKEFWKEWINRCDLEVCAVEYPWHETVMRSSLILKLLFLEPPGSVAAAATTSFPEEIGNGRNWDYRFSWIRDSAFTLQALFWLGHIKEADAYVKWLVSVCRKAEGHHPERLQTMYGLRGQTKLTEFTLDHLEGYQKSPPVRVGNAAYNQDQWDIYGGMLNMMWRLCKTRPDYVITPELWDELCIFANYVGKIWRQPDEGLWEVRGGKRHFTHSKVMCWVALDRAIKLAEMKSLKAPLEQWKQECDAVHKEVMKKAWNEKRQAFTQSFDREELDTAALLMPVLGFIDGEDPKMKATIQRIEQELSMGDGLFLRYTNAPDDGMSSGREGGFLLCSFWMVDALIFAREHEKAKKLFETLLGYANHVGLFSEEIDPVTKEFLGNFPQAYTHIGLINSAFYLSFDPDTLKKIAS
ncbi:MAG: hypothetical protein A3E07_00050 [Candidatus Wildermuthbacteria bacterium RIFCSPHIGHO2_12_FULL_45_9]|uniref:Uncharacterized protein n=1 Tax=Candidatus Wildermuthbacteria bacterium RIFCSPHIGHO2_02_FULL_45_25 TaxID=1802450 RepID=A0A1G2R3V5_9BACT|nr:MAG: hypothetical protein A2748_00770 [Candidatus Wildermuthbacteria bacterium RIFCSPHIGHO2_01_FULL_45_20]OHA67506.1 MAG: hypothetical protein A3C04_00310 [Candidatus Wildermuthbacteria bacterium RIFCSPHIGHO2_02_FULL_45_25]OHA72118.1 MAG: hypothetical protein A3E07_00050 [Candidatus Wildermuthbacteria bacterium RIFCSPHIGHO2_12_FULL_45_9]